MAIIQPYLREFVLGNRDFAQIAMEAVRDMAMSAVTLPEDMRRYLVKANRGELDVRVRGVYEGARTVYTASRQIIYTAIGLVAAFEAIERTAAARSCSTKWTSGVAIGRGAAVLSSVLGKAEKALKAGRRRRLGRERQRAVRLALTASQRASKGQKVSRPFELLKTATSRQPLATLVARFCGCRCGGGRYSLRPCPRPPPSTRGRPAPPRWSSVAAATPRPHDDGVPAAFPPARVGVARRARDLGERRGVRDRRARRARASRRGHRGHRHHQPARDDGRLGPSDRAAHRPRHRLAVPPHGRRVRRAEEGPEALSTRVREKTGLVIDAYFSATKIAWLLDHVSGARARADAGRAGLRDDRRVSRERAHGRARCTPPT